MRAAAVFNSRRKATLLALASALITGASSAQPQGLTIHSRGEQVTQGPAATFTGRVTLQSRFSGSGGSRLGGATVSFQPGARTHWHSHPLGQLLVVTDGAGLIQAEGGEVRAIKAGDVVWTPPGVRHWHGASPTSAMTHVAVVEAKDGETADWGRAVTDAEYGRSPR